MVIIMVVSIFTIVPITAVVINLLFNREDLQFVIPVVYFSVFLFWLGVGIRQWLSIFKVDKEVSFVQGIAKGAR